MLVAVTFVHDEHRCSLWANPTVLLLVRECNYCSTVLNLRLSVVVYCSCISTASIYDAAKRSSVAVLLFPCK